MTKQEEKIRANIKVLLEGRQAAVNLGAVESLMAINAKLFECAQKLNIDYYTL